jgi:hypothetical protein
LFADHAGGLRAVGPDEVDFKTGFGGKPYDQFEHVFPGQSWSDVNRKLITGTTCLACHSDRFFDLRSADAQAEAGARPGALPALSREEALDSAVEWKARQPGWAALRELLSAQENGRP